VSCTLSKRVVSPSLHKMHDKRVLSHDDVISCKIQNLKLFFRATENVALSSRHYEVEKRHRAATPKFSKFHRFLVVNTGSVSHATLDKTNALPRYRHLLLIISISPSIN